MFDITLKTKEILKGSIIKSTSGINLYTPDGMGNYRALWTRDFAYMVEYAGELMPKEDIKACLEYLMNGAAENGWIPDRVEEDGNPRYTAGDYDFPGLPNLDNGPFLVIAADAYFNMLSEEEALALYEEWKGILFKGIECLPKNEDGLIYNDEEAAHSPYGFTDCIRKTGLLSMETLLLWRAWNILAKWQRKTGKPCAESEKEIEKIENAFCKTFMSECGMLYAATQTCKQIDVWASCYAVSIGFPIDSEKIANWLIEHIDEISEHGQIRHLPKDEYWERTFVPVEHGTYQNGAFWAVATGWAYDAIVSYDKKTAQRLLNETLEYFDKYGIYECINGEYKKLDTYVASLTNIYDTYKKNKKMQ